MCSDFPGIFKGVISSGCSLICGLICKFGLEIFHPTPTEYESVPQRHKPVRNGTRDREMVAKTF